MAEPSEHCCISHQPALPRMPVHLTPFGQSSGTNVQTLPSRDRGYSNYEYFARRNVKVLQLSSREVILGA